MVKIRLQRLGRRNRACFRLVVTDARVKRQGAYLEKVGYYDPVEKKAEKQITLDTERIKHWLAQGAQPTESALLLLKKGGLDLAALKPAKPAKKKAKKAPAKPKA